MEHLEDIKKFVDEDLIRYVQKMHQTGQSSRFESGH